MKRFRLLLRHPTFVLSIWFWGGAALAIGITLSGLFRVRASWPRALEAVVRPELPPHVAWRLDWSPAAVTPESASYQGVGGLLGGLSSLAALCVLMAIVNVGALLVARRSRERRDRTIRLSLGAAAADLARERARTGRLLSAGVLVLGVATALLATWALHVTWPGGLQRPGLVSGLPAMVVAAFLLVSLMPRRRGRTAIDFRLLTGRTVTSERGKSRPQARIAGIQFAAAVTIIATAGALLRSAPGGAASESEVPATGLLGVQLALPGDTPTVARAAFFGDLLDRASTDATAAAETIASPGAWLGIGVQDRVMVECGACFQGGMLLPVQPAFVAHHMVSYGFVEALDIPVVAGRAFSADDVLGAERVAMVNEAFAHRSFERGRAIGRRVQVGGMRGEWYTVVGVVRDRVVRGLGAPREGAPAIYLSIQQEPPFAVTVASRREDDDEATAWLHEAMSGLEVDGQLGSTITIEQATHQSVSPLQWFARLYGFVAGLALVLAIAGIGSLVHEAVSALRRELAIRAAVGGRFLHLARVVLGETSRTITLGTCLGLMGAFTAGRLVHMREPTIRSLDLATFVIICAVLSVVALTTTLMETRRLARLESARFLNVE